MKRILVISENIFSDRLIWQMGFENSEELEFTYILSDEFNELEEKYNEYCSKNIFYNFRFKIFKIIKAVYKYISPLDENYISLRNTFEVDSYYWHPFKKYLFKIIIFSIKNVRVFKIFTDFILRRILPYENKLNLRSYNLIFTFSLGNLKSNFISSIINEAKDKKLKSISYIQSWDNPTSKGMPCFQTSYVFVWSPSMKKDVVQNYLIDEPSISIIGTPLFKKKFKENTKSKLLMFATKSSKSFKDNIRILEDIIELKNIFNFELIVRLHPLNNSEKNREELNRFKKLSVKNNFDLLHAPFDNESITLKEDYNEVADKKFLESHILVNIYSTMNLEAIFHNINVINIDYDYRNKESNPRQNILIDRMQVHNDRLMNYNLIPNVSSKKELHAAIMKSFGLNQFNPKTREAVIQNECGPQYSKDYFLELIKRVVNA
tara:strand:- start:9 stop:1310 length:1302 start_codon:yes stop_codon:yes gene_type:complete